LQSGGGTVSLGQFKWGTCLNLWGHLEAILNANSTNMLEHLEYLRSNPTSEPDNQQESLVNEFMSR